MISVSRKRGVTLKQMQAIKQYSRKGFSANKIQKELSHRHMGLRRTVLLGYVREFKEKQAKPHVEKYAPTKYRPAPRIGFLQKQLAVYGTRHGESKRIQMVGSGSQLYRAMILVSRHPPRKQFLTISAEALLDDPHRYLEGGNWDAHPETSS